MRRPLHASQPQRQAERAGGVGLRTKALYGVGGMCESIKAFSFGIVLLFYYTSVLDLSGTLVGIAAAIGLVWDALIDPFVGHLSDRSKSPLGRRHGFMLAGALCMGASFVLVFSPPAGLAPAGLFAWLLVTNVMLRSTQSMFTVPYQALGAELTDDYDERTSIVGYRAGSALAGTMGAALLSLLVFANGASGVSQFDRAAYVKLAAALGVAISGAGLVATLGTLSERRRLKPAPPAGGPKLWAGFQLALANSRYRVVVQSAALFFFATVINAAFAIHYLSYYARILDARAIWLFQLTFYAGALAGVGVWLRVAPFVPKHRAYMGAAIATAVVLALGYSLIGDGRPLGSGQLAPLLAGAALGGAGASALWILPPSMIADLADEDELVTGQRREGVLFGLASCCNQVAASLALVAAGVLLDQFAGLVPGRAEQSVETVERLGMLFSVFPAVLMGAAALLLIRYGVSQDLAARDRPATSNDRTGSSLGA